MAFKNNPIVFLTKKLWEYSAGNRPSVVFYFGLFICANIVNAIEPFIVAKVLDTIQRQGVNQQNLSFILLLIASFILLTIGFWIFHGPARVMETRNAFLVRANYKKFLLDGTLDLSPAWHTDHHSGDTIDKIEKGTNGLYQYSTRTFEVIESVVRLLSSFVILAYFNLHAGYIVAFMVIFTMYLIMKFDKVLVNQYQQINRIDNSISAKIFDVISNVTTVIILRIERLVSKAIVKKILQPFSLIVRNSKINEAKWFFVSMCSSIMTFLVLFSYLYGHVRLGLAITIGTVYLLYSYVQRVAEIFFRFAYQYGDIVQQRTAVLNAEEISNQFEKKKTISAIHLGKQWKELRIESLSFSYHTEEGAHLHLYNVSLSIKRGERTALIGESGSGKTTLLKLLRGLYTPKKVTITLDGKRLTDPWAVINPHMALIPQDPEIFSTTIRENITVGIDHTNALIRKYTDMACFSDVIERLPKKLESSIVEKGVNLSGGEKQRLALARGLMASADKSILLLDEPTSSVDLKNESHIYQNIFSAFKDKAIISSMHRLHLLPLFDMIYFFENGRVIAQGTLNHLLATSRKFQHLWKRYQETQRLDQ
ncbi:ABC transporter ATP-binding protein [Candidatus Uhrbacteria bacterium]|nr:ABC transporter ATP-binding protein [Candidatus Uhrbacteria bacterium]